MGHFNTHGQHWSERRAASNSDITIPDLRQTRALCICLQFTFALTCGFKMRYSPVHIKSQLISKFKSKSFFLSNSFIYKFLYSVRRYIHTQRYEYIMYFGIIQTERHTVENLEMPVKTSTVNIIYIFIYIHICIIPCMCFMLSMLIIAVFILFM